MNWKIKALAQSALSHLPGAGSLNYLGQKFITRAHNPEPIVKDRLEKARWFLRHFLEYGQAEVATARFFEFGAGWDLAGPLGLYCLGVNHQLIVDIEPVARLNLVNGTIGELNRYAAELPRVPGAPAASLQELEKRFGICYRAPADARATSLPRASVDCIVSTYTMEHIPAEDLQAILAESSRILKPVGVMISLIDYQDHYSYRDRAISVYNFLQYTERQWRWFNSSLHYQNRLRHSQYRRMFADAEFEILAEEPKLPSAADIEHLRQLHLAPGFQAFEKHDLAVLSSGMVCRRVSARTAPMPQAEYARTTAAP